MFDSKVQSILHYSSEIWGFRRLDSIEMSIFSHVNDSWDYQIRTPKKMIYGELGRYPPFVNSSVRCLKYWFRLLEMDHSRLPRQAYKILFIMDNNGKTCWASEIRNILSKCGFHFVWLQQGVGNVNAFLKIFKQRLIDFFFARVDGNATNKRPV